MRPRAARAGGDRDLPQLPRPASVMTALVVVESSFGNTLTVAEVLASALRKDSGLGEVTVVRAEDAPTALPPGLDLLVVGAPTHGFTLPTPQSRMQAQDKGAPAHSEGGLREWLADLEPVPHLRVLTFDTSVRLRFRLGCAAKTAARLLRRRGFRAVLRGPSFYVTGTSGPLVDGELRRVAAWAERLHVTHSTR